jgi:hypothetical protein
VPPSPPPLLALLELELELLELLPPAEEDEDDDEPESSVSLSSLHATSAIAEAKMQSQRSVFIGSPPRSRPAGRMSFPTSALCVGGLVKLCAWGDRPDFQDLRQSH